MPLHMAKVRSDNRGPKGAADERTRNSESTAGEGRHRPNVPEVVAVKLLTQKAETILILRRPTAKIAARTVASNESVVAKNASSTKEVAWCVR